MYIVVVECWNVTSKNLIHVLDFVQRMRVERLNGYISLYRDLGHLMDEETDSNYHSGSQESINTNSCSEDMYGSLRRFRKGKRLPKEVEEEDEEVEKDEGVESEDQETIQRVKTKGIHSTVTRVVETITLETEPKVKFPAIN